MDYQDTSNPVELEITPLISSHVFQPISKAQRRVAHIQLVALCWCSFLFGWSDGATGPLLPRIRKVYDVDYQTVSWIFVMACGGMVLGALANIPLSDRFGFGKMLLIGSVLQSCAYVVQAYPTSFPVFVLCFFVGSFGQNIQNIQACAFLALVKHEGERKMAYYQTAYGIGFLLGPLSAAQFSQIRFWSLQYFISSMLCVFNMLSLCTIFQLKGQDDCLHEAGEIVPPHIHTPLEDANKYSQILRSKAIPLLALFLLLYVGVTLTIGGWIVTFVIDERGGGPDSGYVSAAFSGGLALGSIILVPLTQMVGEATVMYLYIALAIISQIFVWFVPSILLDSIAIFAVGFLLGPMYPIVMRHTARVVPRSLVTGSIGWIGAVSAAGFGFLPFTTGWMAQRWGIIGLQPFLVVTMSVMGIVWLMVPKAAAPLPRVS